MSEIVYLDNAATTKVDPQVLEAMLPFLMQYYANPASVHKLGLKSREAIDNARCQLALLINCSAQEVIWTSGATEANNLALKGIAQLYRDKGKHIVTTKSEHKSILDTCQFLEKHGFDVTYLTPARNGRIDLENLSQVLRPDTILVTVAHINNEIGALQDLSAIATIVKQKNILLHVDAAQSLGKVPIDLSKLPIDLMSFSAHKIYGPKGIGGLYLRQKPRVKVAAQIHGGGHENGMRSGTLATHQIVGFGAACAIARNQMLADYKKIADLRNFLFDKLKSLPGFFCNSDAEYGYPGILNFGFRNITNKALIEATPNLAFSTGSACDGKSNEPSHVLRAINIDSKDAECSVRISLGRYNSIEDIKTTITILAEAVDKLQ